MGAHRVRAVPLAIIMLLGVVGSGKTRVARMLARALGARRITTDDIRVALRNRGQPMEHAPRITERRARQWLQKGTSVVLDFDAVNPKRTVEFGALAREFGAQLYLIRIEVPRELIVARLKQKRYTSRDLFRDAGEAIRVHFERTKVRKQFRSPQPDFVINNAVSLGPQVEHVVRRIKGR